MVVTVGQNGSTLLYARQRRVDVMKHNKSPQKVTHTLYLDEHDVLMAIREYAEKYAGKLTVPASAEITLEVPSGGDYSGMKLKLSDFNGSGLKVEWEE
jgi:hypothetical protein